MSHKVGLLITAVFALIVLSGCGSTAPSAAPTSPPLANACGLVPNMDTLVGKTALGAAGWISVE